MVPPQKKNYVGIVSIQSAIGEPEKLTYFFGISPGNRLKQNIFIIFPAIIYLPPKQRKPEKEEGESKERIA